MTKGEKYAIVQADAVAKLGIKITAAKLGCSLSYVTQLRADLGLSRRNRGAGHTADCRIWLRTSPDMLRRIRKKIGNRSMSRYVRELIEADLDKTPRLERPEYAGPIPDPTAGREHSA